MMRNGGILLEGPEGPVNPLLHVMLDATVKRLIDGEDPKEVKQIYNLLRSNGFDEFDAIHTILYAFTEELWQADREGKEFDHSRYVKKARRYAREAIRR